MIGRWTALWTACLAGASSAAPGGPVSGEPRESRRSAYSFMPSIGPHGSICRSDRASRAR